MVEIFDDAEQTKPPNLKSVIHFSRPKGRASKCPFNIAQYQPLKGSSYIDLPKFLKDKKAIINVKNQDDEFLKWALLSALHPVEHGSHPDRLSKYKPYENELFFAGVEFPTPLSQIQKSNI